MRRFLLIALSVSSLSPLLQAASPDTSSLCWPRPPERRRICHERTVALPSDLGTSEGVFSGIAEFLFGGQTTEGWLVQPVGIAVTADGVIYVTDPGARGIHIFSIDGAGGEHRLVTETDDGPFGSPVGIAVGGDGSVYVSEPEAGRVLVLDDDLEFRFAIQTGLRRPTGLAVSGDTLFVADTGHHQVLLFDHTGHALAAYGRRGAGEGELNFPIHLVQSGDLFVVDALNYRIERFSPDGSFRGGFGKQGGVAGSFSSPKAIAADTEGHLYVTDALLDNIQIFSPDGDLLLVVGRQGDGPGEFMSPGGIAVDAAQRIYVVETLNKRIQVFRYLP